MKQLLQAVLLFLLPINGAQAQSGPLVSCTSLCNGALGENIYPNGDFGSGIPNIVPTNPGLAPGYTYQTTPPPNDGLYTLTNNTTPWGWFAADVWINIEDNGPEPNGYMMVVNASYPPGLFFQQTVAVCENTLYEFSVDVINIFKQQYQGSIKPNLSFMIDNVALCETGDIPIDEQWHTVRFSFTTAPGQTSVMLGMRNNAPGGYGNDLAIDNISFRACGPELHTPDTLHFCSGHAVLLEAQVLHSSLPSTVYQWQILSNGLWENIPGADSITWNVPNPQNDAEYRLLVASAIPNLQLPSCRAVSKIIRLKELPALVVTATGTDAACFGQNNGQVSAQALTGLAPYSFVWNTDSTGNGVSKLSPGNYLVTITDALGCTGVADVTVSEAPPLVSGLVSMPVSCFEGTDGQALATASGGTAPYVFAWENGLLGDTIQGLSAGIYTLTVTDDHGCTLTDSISIMAPNALTINTSSTILSCFGGADATLLAAVSGATMPYTYAWNAGQTTAQIQGLSAGTYTLTVSDALGCSTSISVDIESPDLLTLAINTSATSCYGGNDASASMFAQGGTGLYTFLWSNGQTDAQITGLTAGIYTATVTDEQGCSALASANVQEPSLLEANTQASIVSCFGGNNGSAQVTTFGGSDPYHFLWSNGASTAQISGLIAGTYTVTSTDAQGCTQIETVTVDQSPMLQSSTVGEETSCFAGADGAVSVQSIGGQSPHQYLWSNGQNTPAQSGLLAGIYTVTITDALGCSTENTALVNQPTMVALSAAPGAVACFGGSNGMLAAMANGGTLPYSIAWSNGQTGLIINNLSVGTYTLTVTDAQGCTAIASTLVSEPTAIQSIISAQDATCYGSQNGTATLSLNGGTAPYQYFWQNGQTGASAQLLTAGQYSVTATDAQGCTHTNAVSVQQPSAVSGMAQAQEAVCHGTPTGQAWVSSAGGTPPYMYLWQNGQTTAEILGLPSGWYGVQISDAQLCPGTAQVWVGQPPPILVSPYSVPVSCPEVADGWASATANGGTGPYAFTWSNGQAGPAIEALSMGIYTVTATDAQGCTTVTVATVASAPSLSVHLGLDQALFLGEEMVLTAQTNVPNSQIAEYHWTGSGGDAQCAHCFQYHFIPLQSGCQQVQVTSVQGCRAWDEVCFTLRPSRKIYVPNVFHPNEDGDNDFFTIYSDASVKQILYLKVFSRWGEQVFQANNIPTNAESSGWDGTYLGQPMNPAVFVWVAEVAFLDGEVVFLKGDVTLVR